MNILEAQKIIDNRIVGMLLFGNSINELEQRIEEFKNYNICWCGVGAYDILEEFILNKINKRLDIFFDCGEVERPIRFELKARTPKLLKFLERSDNNFHITMHHFTKLRRLLGIDIEDRYKDKIIYAEDICPAHAFCVSFPLLLTCLTVLGAKNIIMFGCDGSNTINSIDSYFHPELVKPEKILANNEIFNLTGDSGWVTSGFPSIFKHVCENGQINPPTILNCSSKTIHNLWQKISYDEALTFIKERT
jgi:hypothetical protein